MTQAHPPCFTINGSIPEEMYLECRVHLYVVIRHGLYPFDVVEAKQPDTALSVSIAALSRAYSEIQRSVMYCPVKIPV